MRAPWRQDTKHHGLAIRISRVALLALVCIPTSQCGSRTALRDPNALAHDAGRDGGSSRDAGSVTPEVPDAGSDPCAIPLPNIIDPVDGATRRGTTLAVRLDFAPEPPVEVELCADAACSVVVRSSVAVETEVTFSVATPGTYYLRVTRPPCASAPIRLLVVEGLPAAPPLIDVNGDGFDDAVIGADLSNSVFVFHGPILGPSSLPDARLRGSIFEYGYRLAVPGDLDGDGYDDLVVGGRAGRVFVHRGSPDGLLAEATIEVRHGRDDVPEPERVGDVNGDGLVDVLVSFPRECELELWLGGELTGISRSNVHSADACSVTSSEWAGRGGADFDGDGFADFVHSASLEGLVTLFAGAPSSPALVPPPLDVGSVGFELEARPAGDLDADGHVDLAVDVEEPRRLIVFWGSSDGVSTSTSSSIELPPVRRRGRHLAPAGDLDGDGVDDLAIGSSGAVVLVFGRRGERTLELHTVPAPSGRSDFGTPVAGVGDLDADGRPDLAVGATYHDPHEVVLMSVDPMRRARAFAHLSAPSGVGRFGISIASR